MKNFKTTMKVLLAGVLAFTFFNACGEEDENDDNLKTLLSMDNIWVEDVMWNCCPTLEIVETFKIGNDTTICEKNYKQILCTRTGSSETDVANDIENKVVGFARETEDGKVYQRAFGEEYLFYDFTLLVGDTIGNELARGSWRVTEVDKVEVLGHLRKRLVLKSRCSSDELVWIEGVGSSQGLFYKGSCYSLTKAGSELGLAVSIQGGGFSSLSSVTQNGTLIYKNE